ncbi:MAG: radical SAM family heme chaperone HemW [Verrucomicrobia bacterium]|nr:radical SAM family heme chaperone HemW [Verrucomicrobiota bacterium]
MRMIGDQSLDNSREASLYFHIPFCSKKCPYCHFFVLPDKPALKDQFLASIAREWKQRLPQLEGKRIVSIYFGGGTPSRLSSEQLQFILDLVFSSGLEIDPACEITMEANPEDASLPHLRGFRSLGINRLSLGIQSLDDQQLHLLDRQHSSQKGVDAILNAQMAGFQNISIDLMYDLPHQTLASWKGTLDQLSQLPITHLSLYNLTFEPHTGFFKRKKELTPHLPNDEESLHLLQEAIDAIEKAGLDRYEISAFARPGMHSRHNTGYWTARSFLGFGPSAFSYWEGKRFRNIAHLNRYSEMLEKGAFPIDFEEELAYPQNLYELFAVQLRLKQGVDLSLFQRMHGSLPNSFFHCLERLEEREWVKKSGEICSLTDAGMLFYDSVAVEMI